jgi:hypothetical protein
LEADELGPAPTTRRTVEAMQFRLLGPLRDDLTRHMLATSEERASIVDELTWRNPAMADLLIDLEGDETCGRSWRKRCSVVVCWTESTSVGEVSGS